MTTASLKIQLQELIANSAAIQSLPEEARQIREDTMLNADDETMQQFIDVLTNEANQLEKINQEMENEAEEINKLIAEAKQLGKQAEREIRKDAEVTERIKDDLRAEALLKQLDEITDSK
jgi:hypothetical protein